MSNTIKGYLFLIAGILGFSMKSIFIKLAYLYHVDTVPLFALRMIFSAPFYVAVLLYIRSNDAHSSSMKAINYFLLILCSLGYYIASITDMYSLKYISVGLERIVLFTFPLFALLFSILILKKKYSLKVMIPFAVCFIGISISFISGVEDAAKLNPLLIGLSLVTISAISYAIYFVLSEKALSNISSTHFNALFMLLVCAFAIIQYLAQYSFDTIFIQENPVYFIAILMAVLSTVLPSFFIMFSIQKLGASTTALFNNLGPFLTIYLGYIVLSEQVSLGEMLGFIVVVLGVASLRKYK